MAGPGNILIRIGADASQAVRELHTVDQSLGKTMTTSEKMGAGIQKAAVPAAVALAAIGAAAVVATKAAIEDAAAQDHLAGILERTTGATDAQVKATEEWIAKVSRSTGVAEAELRPALENLAVATGSVSEAQKDMQAALDISAASGKDLETVTKAIALAQTGATGKLEKLIPGLSQAAKKSNDYKVIMAELATLTGGAMAESTDTAAGQMKIFQNQVVELEQSLGKALLPVIEALAPMLITIADLAADNTGALKVLIAAVTVLAGLIVTASAAMKAYAAVQGIVKAATVAWTGVQWLLNAALNANPIGLIIIAIAALAAGIYLAYTRSETFRRIVGEAMEAVRGAVNHLNRAFDSLLEAAAAAWNWIASHWKLALFAFGPIGAAVYLIATNFDKIKSAAQAAFDYITGAIGAVMAVIRDLLALIGKIKIPKFPNTRLPGPFLAPAGAAATAGPGMRAAGAVGRSDTGGVTVNVYGAVDPEGTARAIRRILDKHDRRQGRTV